MFLAQFKRNHQRSGEVPETRLASPTDPLLPNLRQRISQMFPTRSSAPPEPEEPSFAAMAPSPFGTLTSCHISSSTPVGTLTSARQRYDPFKSFRQQLDLLEGFNYSMGGDGPARASEFGNIQMVDEDEITIKSYDTRNHWRDGAIFEGPHVYEDQRTPEKQRGLGNSKVRDHMPKPTCSQCGSDLMKPLPRTPIKTNKAPAFILETPSTSASTPIVAGTPPRLPPLLSNGTPLFSKESTNDWLCASPGHRSGAEKDHELEVTGGSDESRFMDPEE